MKKKAGKGISYPPEFKFILYLIVSALGLFSSVVVSNSLSQIFNYSRARETKVTAMAYNCPTTSSQTYGSFTLKGHEIEGTNPDGTKNPEMNITLRGYEEVNEAHQLYNVGGATDPNMPPVLGSFFTHIPSISHTYKVHKYDYSAGRPLPGLEDAWPVSVIGMYTAPGETLVGFRAGREIGGGYIATVVYATATTLTLSYSDDESGYPIYIDNFCVDPNLLSLYNQLNAAGRSNMPAIRTGQVIGYGNGSDVRMAIRDTGTYMDPRSRKDWWQGYSADLPPAPNDNQPVNPTPTVYNAPTNIPNYPSPTTQSIQPTTSYSYPTTPIQPTTHNPQPTTYYSYPTAPPYNRPSITQYLPPNNQPTTYIYPTHPPYPTSSNQPTTNNQQLTTKNPQPTEVFVLVTTSPGQEIWVKPTGIPIGEKIKDSGPVKFIISLPKRIFIFITTILP